MPKLYKLAAAHAAYFNNYYRYKMVFWYKFDYSILSRNIMYYKKKGKFQKGTWNDIIISADTLTIDLNLSFMVCKSVFGSLFLLSSVLSGSFLFSVFVKQTKDSGLYSLLLSGKIGTKLFFCVYFSFLF